MRAAARSARRIDIMDSPRAPDQPRELAVLEPVRLSRIIAATAPQVLDVVLVVALEPDHFGIALEGQDVRGDAVEEPAVVRDHHCAAREVQQRILERAQRLHVQIVGRLVEQQHVAAGAQHLGEVHAIALAARELPDQLLLLRAFEIETADVAARGGLVALDADDVLPAGNLLPDGFLVVERVARLIDIGELDAGTDANVAAVGLLGSGEHAEQRGLAGAVRPDDADDAAGRHAEVDVVDQQSVAVALVTGRPPR